jgi:asparagine synthase (glutamine-hydrolysing)
MPVAELLRWAAISTVKPLGFKSRRYDYIRASRSGRRFLHTSLTSALSSDMANTLIPYWLRSGDKTHMGLPIEPRAPFLDYRVVELAFTLPVTYLVRDGWHKWILRKAFEDVLPETVVWRRNKMGFPFPYARFFRESREIVRMILDSARNPYVDLAPPARFERDWHMVSFLLWYELFFHGNRELFARITRLHEAATGKVDYGYAPEFMLSAAMIHG